MGVSGRNGFVAFESVVGPICDDTADVLAGQDLVQEIGQYGRITDVAVGNLNCPNLQRFLVDAYMYLAPDASFRVTMLAGVPLTFALCFYACAIHGQAIAACSDERGSRGTADQCHRDMAGSLEVFVDGGKEC